MSVAAFLSRYTPAQLEAHNRLKAARARMQAAAEARIAAERQARAKAEAEEFERTARDRQLLADITDLVRKARAAALPKQKSRPPKLVAPGRVPRVLADIATLYEIDPEQILVPSKNRLICAARAHAAVLLAKGKEEPSIKQISYALKVDHTSIILCIRRWNTWSGENVRNLGRCNRARRTYEFLFRRFPSEAA